jgi:predicted acylesterase/phospholipase RssA
MNRVDIIANIIQIKSTSMGTVRLAELIDNAIVEQIYAQVGTAYNLGYDEGYEAGLCDEA